jgi:hypothetical protein
MALDIVSNSIYFIQEGVIDIAYKDFDAEDANLITLEAGSYFGDVSYILEVKN